MWLAIGNIHIFSSFCIIWLYYTHATEQNLLVHVGEKRGGRSFYGEKVNEKTKESRLRSEFAMNLLHFFGKGFKIEKEARDVKWNLI